MPSCRAGRSPHRMVPALAWLALLSSGCGAEGPDLIDVTGVVTFNGLPARAEVLFEPVSPEGEPGGRASSAWTRPDGSFRLGFTRERFGAIPGRHRVRIEILRPESSDVNASFEESTAAVKSVRLVREVSAAENQFNFAISW